ncbi:cupin domain-containing protein [Georgenia subflava]|uniref:Cupin domain-containing protein n=1 Tax=Georgenia subflava TaxID=1622177 RepID=A0A6N7ECM4_9MICO|nr:cupin domain-containing protein [Georgenia subflava]MPV36172.1 cupin domain-containing protein [Georgenia subflava]
MYTLTRAQDQPSTGGRTRQFIGERFGAGVSFYLVDDDPGHGPALHRHPYTETWLVLEGRATITADGQEVDAGPGDIVTVAPRTPHKFVAAGDAPLKMVCIHASPTMVEETLDDDGTGRPVSDGRE